MQAVLLFSESGISRKYLNFAAILSCCTKGFQKIISRLKSSDNENRREAIKLYVDLCNEELFYYLPHFRDEKHLSNSSFLLIMRFMKKRCISDYPRTGKFFKIDKDCEIHLKDDKIELIKTIGKKITELESNKLAVLC